MDEKKKRLCTEHREQASQMALLPHPINQSFFFVFHLSQVKQRHAAQKKNGVLLKRKTACKIHHHGCNHLGWTCKQDLKPFFSFPAETRYGQKLHSYSMSPTLSIPRFLLITVLYNERNGKCLQVFWIDSSSTPSLAREREKVAGAPGLRSTTSFSANGLTKIKLHTWYFCRLEEAHKGHEPLSRGKSKP